MERKRGGALNYIAVAIGVCLIVLGIFFIR